MIRQYIDLLDPDGAGFWRLRPEPIVWATLAGWAFVLYSVHAVFQRLIFPLDWFDIIIHEAGHPIFGLLGNRWLMFAGGTLNQMLFPWIFYFNFLRQRSPKSADFCLFWFGSNFLNIGPYMADARDQVLPLIGGGEHDWTYLLASVGLLQYDKQIGALSLYFGCFAMAFSAYTLLDHIRNPAPRPKLATEAV